MAKQRRQTMSNAHGERRLLSDLLVPWWDRWHGNEMSRAALRDHFRVNGVLPRGFADLTGGGVLPGFACGGGIRRAFSLLALHAGELPWLHMEGQQASANPHYLRERVAALLRGAELYRATITAAGGVEVGSGELAVSLDAFLQLEGQGRPQPGAALALLSREASGAFVPLLLLPLARDEGAAVDRMEASAPWTGLPTAMAASFRRWMLLRAASEPVGVPLSDAVAALGGSAAARDPMEQLRAAGDNLRECERSEIHALLALPLFGDKVHTRADLLLMRMATPGRRDLLREMLGLVTVPALDGDDLAQRLVAVPPPADRAWWVWAHARIPLLVDYAEGILLSSRVLYGLDPQVEQPAWAQRRAFAKKLQAAVRNDWVRAEPVGRYGLALALLASWCEEAYGASLPGVGDRSPRGKALARVANATGRPQRALRAADMPASYRALLSLPRVGEQTASGVVDALEAHLNGVLGETVPAAAAAATTERADSEELSATLSALADLLEEDL